MGAEGAMKQFLSHHNITVNGPEGATERRTWDLFAALAARDRRKYLAVLNRDIQNKTFEAAILQGRPKEAAELIVAEPTDKGFAGRDLIGSHALVFLAACRAKEESCAAEHFEKFADGFRHGGKTERLMARILDGQADLDWDIVRAAPVDPGSKRFLLTVLAKKHPDLAEKLLDLARKLNYQRDAFGLCLAALIGG
jgi:hypothetical protein